MVNNMSDPVKNAEVEDVLSSIRRLVSEDKRPLQTTPKPEPKPDRLVLTPALRVEETSIPDLVEDAVEEVVEAEIQAAFAAEEEAVDHAFEPEASGDAQRAPEEDYTSDPYGFDDETNLDGEVAEEQPVQSAPAEMADPSGSTEVEALSAKIAALETAIGDIAEEWEPDGDDGNANAAEEAPTMSWEDVEVSDGDAQEADKDPEVEAVFADQAEPEPEIEESSFEEVPAPEEVAAEVAAEPAQDDPEPADIADEERIDVGTTAPFTMPAEDQLLDEDTLREMITEIVHAELQGALGERITRNVRRLVRREIHRALTARDLD